MGIWQIIYVALLMLSLGISLAKHGEPRDDKYSFGASFIATAIQIAILYAGGFFS